MGRGSRNDWRSLSLFPGPQIRQLVARQGRSGLLITAAAVAALALVIIVGPPIPPATSIQTSGIWDVLYRDGWWKQATGFGLLGYCVLAAASRSLLAQAMEACPIRESLAVATGPRSGRITGFDGADCAHRLAPRIRLQSSIDVLFFGCYPFRHRSCSGQRPPARSCDVLAPPSRRLAASRVNHFPHLVVLLLLMPCAPAVARLFGS